MLGPRWEKALQVVEIALQPVVNIYSGQSIGYEALLRHYIKAGFESPHDFFSAAFEDRTLRMISLMLFERALLKRQQLPHHDHVRIFFNVDRRDLSHDPPLHLDLIKVLNDYQLDPGVVCLEASERNGLNEMELTNLAAARQAHFKICLDDFGTGTVGVKILQQLQPDYIKLDRTFIENLADARRKSFAGHLVNLAHSLGTLVIAEGVEQRNEYYQCKELTCDLVQGYFVQRPVLDPQELLLKYDEIENAHRTDRRESNLDKRLIDQYLQYLPPVPIQTEMEDVFKLFKQNKDFSLFPVVTAQLEPLGVIRDHSIKDFVYSLYGRDLLRNRAFSKSLNDFVTKTPAADINTKAEKILEIFTQNKGGDGIIITADSRYLGFLSAMSLLNVLNEKNLHLAREQNPLSKLPGNNLVYEYVSELLADLTRHEVLVYFNFNHFKPFNERYGFRNGDRAILLFADQLRRHHLGDVRQLGHLGGDDFFAALPTSSLERTLEYVSRLTHEFGNNSGSLYEPEDRKNGYITVAQDDVSKRYPLLSVRTVVLEIPPRGKKFEFEEISMKVDELKVAAKWAEGQVLTASLKETPVAV